MPIAAIFDEGWWRSLYFNFHALPILVHCAPTPAAPSTPVDRERRSRRGEKARRIRPPPWILPADRFLEWYTKDWSEEDQARCCSPLRSPPPRRLQPAARRTHPPPHQHRGPRAPQDATFEPLHERYAPLALDVIRKLRGFYIKLGQIGATRSDFVARQYIERRARAPAPTLLPHSPPSALLRSGRLSIPCSPAAGRRTPKPPAALHGTLTKTPRAHAPPLLFALLQDGDPPRRLPARIPRLRQGGHRAVPRAPRRRGLRLDRGEAPRQRLHRAGARRGVWPGFPSPPRDLWARVPAVIDAAAATRPDALSGASQVHKARLKDGRLVAVKARRRRSAAPLFSSLALSPRVPCPETPWATPSRRTSSRVRRCSTRG